MNLAAIKIFHPFSHPENNSCEKKSCAFLALLFVSIVTLGIFPTICYFKYRKQKITPNTNQKYKDKLAGVASKILEPTSSQPILPLPSYQRKVNESVTAFNIRIFEETLSACENGYLNKNQSIVKIDNEPMLKETVTFKNLDPLQPPLENYKTKFSVDKRDTFQVLLERKKAGAWAVGVNMANSWTPGGGVASGCTAQEEALCRRSNHLLGLKTQNYPLPEFGGIYCPHVKVFRNTDFAFFNEPEEVDLVAMAAYDLRENSSDLSKEYREGMENKIRNMLRIMSIKGHTELVLGAIGCGAFENPPKIVSDIFRKIFQEPEFKGRFKRVDFAILEMSLKDAQNVTAFSGMCEELNGAI